jgi:hypothetical protein
MADWMVATGVASMLLFGMEIAKIVLRIKRPDPYVAPATSPATTRASGAKVSRGQVASRA